MSRGVYCSVRRGAFPMIRIATDVSAVAMIGQSACYLVRPYRYCRNRKYICYTIVCLFLCDMTLGRLVLAHNINPVLQRRTSLSITGLASVSLPAWSKRSITMLPILGGHCSALALTMCLRVTRPFPLATSSLLCF